MYMLMLVHVVDLSFINCKEKIKWTVKKNVVSVKAKQGP